MASLSEDTVTPTAAQEDPNPILTADLPDDYYNKSFTQLRKIGEGGFGAVYHAKHKNDDYYYAIKKIEVRCISDTSNSETAIPRSRHYLNEVRILAKLYHRNIVKYHHSWLEMGTVADLSNVGGRAATSAEDNGAWDWATEDNGAKELQALADEHMCWGFGGGVASSPKQTQGPTSSQFWNNPTSSLFESQGSSVAQGGAQLYQYIQMEYCSGKSLNDFIRDEKRQEVNVKLTLDIVHEIADGLAYIHAQNVIHRDLKPDNVFLQPNDATGSFCVKIGDFGLSRVVPAGTKHIKTGGDGTKLYMAPEQKGGNCSSSSDMFALGLIFFEMCHPSFSTNNEWHDALCNARTLGNNNPSLMRWKAFGEENPEIKVLVTALLEKDPDRRPNAKGLTQEIIAMRMGPLSTAMTPLHPEEQNFIRLSTLVGNMMPKILRRIIAVLWNRLHGDDDALSGDATEDMYEHMVHGNETCERELPDEVQCAWDDDRVVFTGSPSFDARHYFATKLSVVANGLPRNLVVLDVVHNEGSNDYITLRFRERTDGKEINDLSTWNVTKMETVLKVASSPNPVAINNVRAPRVLPAKRGGRLVKNKKMQSALQQGMENWDVSLCHEILCENRSENEKGSFETAQYGRRLVRYTEDEPLFDQLEDFKKVRNEQYGHAVGAKISDDDLQKSIDTIHDLLVFCGRDPYNVFLREEIVDWQRQLGSTIGETYYQGDLKKLQTAISEQQEEIETLLIENKALQQALQDQGVVEVDRLRDEEEQLKMALAAGKEVLKEVTEKIGQKIDDAKEEVIDEVVKGTQELKRETQALREGQQRILEEIQKQKLGESTAASSKPRQASPKNATETADPKDNQSERSAAVIHEVYNTPTYRNHDLIHAVGENRPNHVKIFLNESSDVVHVVGEHDEYEGKTALLIACEKGFAECVEQLMKHIDLFDLINKERDALEYAVENDRDDCVQNMYSSKEVQRFLNSLETPETKTFELNKLLYTAVNLFISLNKLRLSFLTPEEREHLGDMEDETKKKFVASIQNWKCGKCGNQLPAWFEVDHKIRFDQGGDNHVDNLVALCRSCQDERLEDFRQCVEILAGHESVYLAYDEGELEIRGTTWTQMSPLHLAAAQNSPICLKTLKRAHGEKNPYLNAVSRSGVTSQTAKDFAKKNIARASEAANKRRATACLEVLEVWEEEVPGDYDDDY